MNFENTKELEAWLEDRPPDVGVVIAARAAARVWPAIAIAASRPRARDGSSRSHVLPSAWGLMRTMLDPAGEQTDLPSPAEITRSFDMASVISLTRSALAAVRNAVSCVEPGDRKHQIIQAVCGMEYLAVELAVNSRANNGASQADRRRNTIPEATRKAARNEVVADGAMPLAELLRRPLWGISGPPNGLRPEDIGETLLDTDPNYAFFRRWYDGMVSGRLMPAELLCRIVTEIPRETWASGAEPVAREIARIEAQYLAESAPLAEQVDFNPKTGKLRVTPIPMQNAAFIGALVTRTEDAIEDALLGRNGLRDDMSEVRKLRRAHTRYANDPQQIELTYTSVSISLRRQIDKTGELSRSADNLSLLEAVEEGALAIRAQHPEVAANRTVIARQKLRELDPADIELLEDAAPVLAEISEGLMQEDFARDVPKLINDAARPLPSGAPPLPGMDESMRIFSRVAKSKLRWEDAAAKGATAFDSKEFKTVRLGLTVGDLLSRLVALGLRLFGVL